jgi:hypothetical protein
VAGEHGVAGCGGVGEDDLVTARVLAEERGAAGVEGAGDWGRHARQRGATYSPSSLEVEVLNSEVVVCRSQAVVHHLFPRPSPAFIEHNIVRSTHMLCLRVEDAAGLRALCVADEHSRSAPVIELADVAKLLGEREAAKDLQVGDRRLAPMPSLVWRPTVECLGRRAVEDVDSRHHGLSPEDSRHPLCLRRARAIPTTVWLRRSTTPFYYGLYGVE